MPSRLSSLLVRDGLVGVKRMEHAFQRQVIYGGCLDTILLEMSLVPEERLLQYLSLATGLPPATRAETDAVDIEAVDKCPSDLARAFRVVPLCFEEGALRVLVHDPVDLALLEELANELEFPIQPLVVPEYRFHLVYARMFGGTPNARFTELAKRAEESYPSSPVGRAPTVIVEGPGSPPRDEVEGDPDDDLPEAVRAELQDYLNDESPEGSGPGPKKELSEAVKAELQDYLREKEANGQVEIEPAQPSAESQASDSSDSSVARAEGNESQDDEIEDGASAAASSEDRAKRVAEALAETDESPRPDDAEKRLGEAQTEPMPVKSEDESDATSSTRSTKPGMGEPMPPLDLETLAPAELAAVAELAATARARRYCRARAATARARAG